MKAILMIGFLINGTIFPNYELSGISYETMSQCEEARSHRVVIATYQDIAKCYEGELRMWCEPIERASK